MPALTASLGPPPRRIAGPTRHTLDLYRVFCFERDWSFNNGESPTPDSTSSTSATNGLLLDTPASKKRKLKDGKAIALDQILDGR